MDWLVWLMMLSFLITGLGVVAGFCALVERDIKELRREHFRFSLRALLIATTLVAVGLGVVMLLTRL